MKEVSMVVCQCRGVTDRQIRRHVKNGATSTREVARATGAGMKCGGCRPNVSKVVNEAVEHEFAKARPSFASEMLPLTIPVEG